VGVAEMRLFIDLKGCGGLAGSIHFLCFRNLTLGVNAQGNE
jgi:hypothetical protein